MCRCLRLLLVCATLTWPILAAPVQIFVSPEGDDAWSGTQPKAAFVGAAGPFRSLARVRLAVRQGAANADGVRVILAPGEYLLPAGFVLGPEDLGTVAAPVTYEAAPEANVVLRGDVPLTGRRRHPNGSQIATRPSREGVALFHGDEALPLSRYPNRDAAHPRSGGFCYVTQAEAAAGTLFLLVSGSAGLAPDSWAHLTEATVQLWPDDGTRRDVQLTAANRETGGLCLPEQPGIKTGTRLVFTGLLSELDAPGEWLPVGETLRFLPPEPGEPDQPITVSTANPLLDIRGEAGKAAAGVSFVGIEFRGAAGDLVRVTNAACSLTRCAFRAATGDGIRADQASGSRVEGCDFRQLGGAAIRLTATRGATVRNCWIAETGSLQPVAAAIVTDDEACADLTITQNLIHDQPASGILLRGGGHRCEGNWLHHLGQERSEGGGILVLSGEGDGPTSVRGNVVADPGGYRRIDATHYAFPAGTVGIAALGGTGTVIAENLLLRCPLAGVLLAGRDQVVESNLLVGDGESQIGVGAASALTVRRNVAFSPSGNAAWLVGDRLPECLKAADGNLVWSEGRDPWVRAAGKTLAWNDWQALGFDLHSVLADPMFRAPQLDEYALLPDSLALRLGFVPPQPEQAGCQEDATRRTWPIDDDLWREQHLLGVAGARSVSRPTEP